MLDSTETLGLGSLAEKVAELSRLGQSRVELLSLPAAALPPGLVVEDPQLIVETDGAGHVKLHNPVDLLAGLRGKPVRRKGADTTTTLDSFCKLVKRNGDADTVVFLDATWTAPKLTAVLNYHRAVELTADANPSIELTADAVGGDDPLARFGDHRVVYAFPFSEPWKAWVAMNDKPMTQADFAAWLEDHIHEIAMPDTDPSGEEARWQADFRTRIATPTELLDLARGLEVTVGAKIKSKHRMQTGETAMVFETEHRTSQDGGEVTVPGLFVLRLPIFFRGLAQRIPVKLRYRPAGDKGVLWFYELHRPDEVVEARLRDDAHEVASRTGHLVIDGAAGPT